MTREEEIKEAAQKYIYNKRYYESNIRPRIFEAGATWADCHPINPWHTVADGDYPARVLDTNGDEHYKSETVVVTDGKTWTIAMYDYDLHKWSTMLNVTHWIEIPQLPK